MPEQIARTVESVVREVVLPAVREEVQREIQRQLGIEWYMHLASKFEPGFALPPVGSALLGYRLRCYVVAADGTEVPWVDR